MLRIEHAKAVCRNESEALKQLHDEIVKEFQHVGEKKTSLSRDELDDYYADFLDRLMLSRKFVEAHKGYIELEISLEKTGVLGETASPLTSIPCRDPERLSIYTNELGAEVDFMSGVIQNIEETMEKEGFKPEPRQYLPYTRAKERAAAEASSPPSPTA